MAAAGATIVDVEPFDSADLTASTIANTYDLLDRPAWQRAAACRIHNLHLWYPERGESATGAKAICATCPVADQCSDAGTDEQYGIWGGEGTRASRRRRKLIRSSSAPAA